MVTWINAVLPATPSESLPELVEVALLDGKPFAAVAPWLEPTESGTAQRFMVVFEADRASPIVCETRAGARLIVDKASQAPPTVRS